MAGQTRGRRRGGYWPVILGVRIPEVILSTRRAAQYGWWPAASPSKLIFRDLLRSRKPRPRASNWDAFAVKVAAYSDIAGNGYAENSAPVTKKVRSSRLSALASTGEVAGMYTTNAAVCADAMPIVALLDGHRRRVATRPRDIGPPTADALDAPRPLPDGYSRAN